MLGGNGCSSRKWHSEQSSCECGNVGTGWVGASGFEAGFAE